MNDSLNTIFLDFKATFFPERTKIILNSNTEKLTEFNLIEYIQNSNADSVAISLFNKLNKEQIFNVVLIDSWINEKIHTNKYFQDLLAMNNLNIEFHENWLLPYSKKETHSPLIGATEWMKLNPRENYTILLKNEYKNKLDFVEDSIIDYNHSIFIDEKNGLSLDNLNEISKSLNLWWN